MAKNRKVRQQVTVDKASPRASVFQAEFREDLLYWAENNQQVFKKIFDLIEAVTITPFDRIGKPEPLKYDLAGCWSRRITQEHRLVYLVTNTKIDFLMARYHY